MDCPVCKCPNPQGATHCNMCYEVFNRSAAQSYLHAVKKERREAEGYLDESSIEIKSQQLIEDAQSAFSKVDWKAVSGSTTSLLRRARFPLFLASVLAVLWIVGGTLLNPQTTYHLFGKKLTYAFSRKGPAQYLIGMKQQVKCWSERGGRLDTPLGEFSQDEMGNLLIENKSTDKNSLAASVSTKEWIQILNDSAGAESHTLPNDHPSLSGARLVFDKKGTLLERHVTLSPRVGKSLPFLVPRFPAGTLRQNATWSEAVEWIDIYKDWKIAWSGSLHWTLGDLVPCGRDTCAKLHYTAEIHPRLRGTPDWTNGSAHQLSGTATGEGDVLFDYAHHQLLSNTFSYDGLLRIPIKDLGLIPWELRIGRRVKKVPGDLLVRFQNTIDIRKN